MIYNVEDVSYIFKKNITGIMLELDINQSKLADISGVTRATISKIFTNSGRLPSLSVLCKICNALSIDIDTAITENYNNDDVDRKLKAFYLKFGIIEELDFYDQSSILELAKRLGNGKENDN